MRTIFAEYNPQRNSIDVYTSAGYMLRIDCWEAEKDLKTTPGSDCALNTLAIDEPLEYARLYLDGNLYWNPMLSERLVGRTRILLKKVDSSPIGGCPLRGRRLVTASYSIFNRKY